MDLFLTAELVIKGPSLMLRFFISPLRGFGSLVFINGYNNISPSGLKITIPQGSERYNTWYQWINPLVNDIHALRLGD